MGQIKEAKLKRDPRSLKLLETKDLMFQRAKKHLSLMLIRLRA